MFYRALAHPLTRGIDIDDPRTTDLRSTIIQQKPILRKIYREWYRLLSDDLPVGDGHALELGSGGGFLDQFIPDLITSDMFVLPKIHLVMDGRRMPLADASLRAIVMTNVFHHIPDARAFLAEAARTVRPGGVVAMIEPWNNPWARFICSRLHHEEFDPNASQWEFKTQGPLSGSNHALPWIVFQRDRAKFEQRFPQWKIEKLQPLMPLCYLMSGGVSMRPRAPGFMFNAIRILERPFESSMAIFAHLLLRKR